MVGSAEVLSNLRVKLFFFCTGMLLTRGPLTNTLS